MNKGTVKKKEILIKWDSVIINAENIRIPSVYREILP